MPDVVSVVFDRWDRYPGIHEYGPDIDTRLDRLAGGRSELPRDLPDRSPVPIRGFAATLELHETGPIFVLELDRLAESGPLLDDVRMLGRAWYRRSTGSEPKELSVSIRCGPRAGGDSYESQVWARVLVKTDPLTAADHLDEFIDFVTTAGRR